MKYGNFSKDGLEFIITTPNTPRPWINYLTNEDYCSIISQCAGGYSFYKDCRSDRITRWNPENYHEDRPGKYVYLRDNKSKRYWSTTYQPIRSERYTKFETRHGLGYTVIKTIYYGIESEITYFVPTLDTCEIWLVKLTNKTSRNRELTLIPYVEWLIGDYHMELRYRNIMNLYNRFWLDEKSGIIFARKTAVWGTNIQSSRSISFFASSLPLKGCATRKDAFLGAYNTEERPKSLISGDFVTSKTCSGEDGIGAFRHIVKLKPKEAKEFVIILGAAENKNRAKTIVSKYRSLKNAKSELENTKRLWRKRILDNIMVETPDKNFDLVINTWVKYQLYICNMWSRSPSYYHEGSGGRGYRDSCQDAEAIITIDPKHALSKIRTIAGLTRRDGSCAGGWSSTRGPVDTLPNKDHPTWLVSTVSAYIKEMGDKKILFEKFPYLKDGWIKRATKKDINWTKGVIKDKEGTLFEHLEKNLNFTFTDVGKRGLPLIGHADWNDGIDAAGRRLKGESVWLAMALVRSYNLLSELADIIDKKRKAKEFRRRTKIMTQRINDYCWDGNWYLRGFTDYDTLYGSARNKEGKIFLNTQSWAVLSGVADRKKCKKLFKAIDKYLDGKHGSALFYPAYSNFNPKLGRMTMFSEGTKENAAVFCHAAIFKVVADCVAGRGNKAYESMRKIMPNNQKNMDIYKTEPYAYAEYLIGPEHPYRYGEGAFTWITGTAGWSFIAATEHLLGVQKEFRGLRINPTIPSHWKRCVIKRLFRGNIYKIIVKNPRGVQSGVKSMKVNGIKQKHNLIKVKRDKKTHVVEVLLG